MLEHIVLFKFQKDASQEKVDAVMHQLRELPKSIDAIVQLSCGPNFSDRSQGFDYALRVQLRDKEGLETYRTHPAHVSVLENTIKPILENILAVDYLDS